MGHQRMHVVSAIVLMWTCCGFMAVEGITIDPHRQLSVEEGSLNIEMRCTLQRYGVVRPVTYRWFHRPTSERERQLYTTTHFMISTDGSMATLDRAQRTDSGVFTAIASDSARRSGNCTFYVQVQYAPVFESPMVPQVIQINAPEPVVLTCPYDSNPESRVTWLKDGATLRYNNKFVFSGKNLTITATDSADTGSYQCRAANTYGTASGSTISLQIRVPMQFVTIPSTVEIFTMGRNATLTCSARGSPRPTIEWKKDTLTLTNNRLRTITQSVTADATVSTVEYSSVGLEDRGTYSCSARNANQTLQHLFEIAVNAPPEITSIFNSVMNVRIGAPLVLHCQASGIPKPSFTWLKDDRAIARVSDTHFQEGWDGYLRVTEVIGSDAGLYQCRAVNEVGEAFSEAFTLVVTGLHFLIKPKPDKYVFRNATAQMNCKVAGSRNRIQIDWLKDGRNVARRCSQADFNNSLCTGTFVVGDSLYVSKMSQADVGLYSCVATEQGGGSQESIRANSRIQILVPVEFDPALPNTVRGDFHRGLTLRCQAKGMPPPKIEWLRHGVHILNNTYRTVIGGLMKFRALHVADADRYTCIATNKAGEKSQNVRIVINTVLVTPAALSVTVTPYSYVAQVLWSIIANGGYRVISFQLEYRQIKPTVSEWTVYKDISPKARTFGLKDLEPEHWYQINVWANNQLGKGEVVTADFQTKEAGSESGGVLELSISQLIIIIVIIIAAIGMLIAIICVIVIKRHGSDLAVMRARQGAQDDSHALVASQQDQSHVNPAYDGGAANSPDKALELKEMSPAAGEGSGGAAANTKANATAAGQNGDAKKETTAT